MQRRTFLQSLCIASVSVLPACKSTNPTQYYRATKTSGELVIPKTLLSSSEPFLVSYQDDVIAISFNETNKNEVHYASNLLKCTHMGCRIEKAIDGYICPCHGARFNDEGHVTKGPALKNLASYPTRHDALNIYINVSYLHSS